jgi:hypothetical protein
MRISRQLGDRSARSAQTVPLALECADAVASLRDSLLEGDGFEPSVPLATAVQAPLCSGSCAISSRGRWSGSGLRFGRPPSRIGSGRLSAAALAISSASPASSSSSRSSSCSICRVSRSEERPNCIRRSLAIWNFSFSISRAQLDGKLCRRQLSGRRRQFALAGQGKSPQCVGIGGQIG